MRNLDQGMQVVLVLLGLIATVVLVSAATALALFLWRRIGKIRTASGGAAPSASVPLLRTFAVILLGAGALLGVAASVITARHWLATAPPPAPAAVVAAPPASAAPNSPVEAKQPSPPANEEQRSGEMPVFSTGEAYAAIREKLIARGWQPFQAPDAAVCPEHDVRCKDRPEMQSCSSAGMANCEFLWKQGSNLLRIYTTGDAAGYQGSTMMTMPAQYSPNTAAGAQRP